MNLLCWYLSGMCGFSPESKISQILFLVYLLTLFSSDERVGGEKRNVQSLKSGMEIFEIAQWDTWSRYFWEIVSIFLIFDSGCHLSFLDQRFLCLMLYIYFKSQYAPKPVTRRNVTKEHSTHNFGEYEHYKILMVTSFGTFWLFYKFYE